MQSRITLQGAPCLRYLTRDQMEELHFCGLEILERTGVQVDHQEARDLLKSAGAIVEDTLVRIPEGLVKTALNSVPSRIVMANRDGERCMFLEGRRSYYGTGSCCPYTIDPFTGKRRSGTKNDVANMARVCDSLPNLNFVMSMNLVRDKYPEIGYVHEFDAMVRNTIKPIIMSVQDAQNTKDIIEMAEAVMGGPEELRKKCILAIYSETTSPLRHSDDALGKVLVCAEKWVPIIHTVGQMSGATSPVTMAGALAQANAELLSALVIHQLKQPGAPFLYGGTITPIDMRTMAHPYGAPEFQVYSAALTEMGVDYYRIPVFSTGGCSDAKTFDQQAASEATYSLVLQALAGGNLIHDIGFIDSGLTSSLSEIVFCDEVIELIKHVVRGIAFGDEEKALDVIHSVGPGGDFLGEEHTFKNFKRIFSPSLFTRETHNAWEGNGRRTLGEKLDEKVRNILENYSPKSLPKKIDQTLDVLIEKYTREAEQRIGR